MEQNPQARAALPQTHFFTVRLENRQSDLLVTHVDLLRSVIRSCMARRPFQIDSAVILPGFLHMIWTLPAEDTDYSARWRQIKSTFSRHVDAPACTRATRRGDKGIWQRRFWQHEIAGPADLALHRAIVLTAPVRAGWVSAPQDWPHSSIHRDGADALAEISDEAWRTPEAAGWV